MKKQTLSARKFYLTKRNRVVLSEGASETPLSMVMTMVKNLEPLGFTLSRQLAERLLTQPPESTANLYQEILPVLKEMTGAHRNFSPMYPNFPAQVMDASELELYWNAMVHYWSAFVADVTGVPGVITLPHYEKEERPELQQEVKLKVIDLGSQADFETIFTQLVGANSSISEGDKEILGWFLGTHEADVQRMLPDKIQQKETLAFLVGGLLTLNVEPTFLLPNIKTATDVLRVVVAMCPDGDVSLSKATKFKRFTRKERRYFLSALENCGEITEDMLRYKGYWKRLGRELRPGDWSNRYPKAYAAFDILRNDKPFSTFNSKVEAGLQSKAVGEILELLQQRPGVFARRLDHAMRVAGTGLAVDVTDAFVSVADKVSTPVLLQVYNHFKNRSTNFSGRAFFPKGSVAKVQVDEVPLPPLPPELTDAFARQVRQTLVKRFSALPKMGTVYVDESMKEQIVPFAMRSASKSLRTVARGSRMLLPDNDVIRFFLWWTDGSSRTDIDLSAVGYDTNWRRTLDVSYYNLRDTGVCHSGDITSAPKGACEFIDVDVKKVLASGIRFIGLNIYSFTDQNFCDLPECFAGWMGRDSMKTGNLGRAAQSGDIFDARTVHDKIDLAMSSTVGIPIVFDLEKRQAIWMDVALTNRNQVNNASRNGDRVSQMCKAIAELNKPNLYDLFCMHGEARGLLTIHRGEAETIFSLHEGTTPYDTDKIMSDFMI